MEEEMKTPVTEAAATAAEAAEEDSPTTCPPTKTSSPTGDFASTSAPLPPASLSPSNPFPNRKEYNKIPITEKALRCRAFSNQEPPLYSALLMKGYL